MVLKNKNSESNFFLKKNKGISNVISTVLLIGITIVIVGIVWFTINNLVGERIKSSECMNVFEKVLINDYYTCYNSSSKELKISVELRDIEIDSVLVAVYSEDKSKTFEIPSTSGYDYVKPYNGNYNTGLQLRSENSAVTYIFNSTKAEIEKPSMIKISPTINDQQCEVSDTTMNIERC